MQTRPGLPPGEDARENAPMRYYVPVPVETYEKRSFATVLPKTWEGEVVTIGAPDVPEMTEESIAEAKLVPVTASSTAAFLEYSNSVKAEREAALAAYVLFFFEWRPGRRRGRAAAVAVRVEGCGVGVWEADCGGSARRSSACRMVSQVQAHSFLLAGRAFPSWKAHRRGEMCGQSTYVFSRLGMHSLGAFDCTACPAKARVAHVVGRNNGPCVG